MRRSVKLGVAFGAAAAATAAVRHARPAGHGRATPGGVLIDDAAGYDRLASWLLGGFYQGIAADVAASLPPGGRVLDVGCGPGSLVARLADRGLDVTGVDLDPAMVHRAAARLRGRAEVRVADVGALPFADGAFDLVVSTLSMHHWSDPARGLGEIARVIGPAGRALVWDIGGRRIPLHGRPADPADRIRGSALELVSATDWRWPARLALTRRLEARRAR